MPLGMEIDLGPGHTVLNGDSASPPIGAQQPSIFSARVYCGQTVAHFSYCWALVNSIPQYNYSPNRIVLLLWQLTGSEGRQKWQCVSGAKPRLDALGGPKSPRIFYLQIIHVWTHRTLFGSATGYMIKSAHCKMTVLAENFHKLCFDTNNKKRKLRWRKELGAYYSTKLKIYARK